MSSLANQVHWLHYQIEARVGSEAGSGQLRIWGYAAPKTGGKLATTKLGNLTHKITTAA